MAFWLHLPSWFKMAAMSVYQANPVGVELFSYINASFHSNKFARVLATWVKAFYKIMHVYNPHVVISVHLASGTLYDTSPAPFIVKCSVAVLYYRYILYYLCLITLFTVCISYVLLSCFNAFWFSISLFWIINGCMCSSAAFYFSLDLKLFWKFLVSC